MRRHPRARRLQVVLDLTEREEQEALRVWGEIQQKLNDEKMQRQQLQEYTQEYQQKISAPATTAVSAGIIHNALGFMAQIETALQRQNEQIRLLQGRAEKAQESYLILHGKVKALTELIERLEQEAQQLDDKDAQKQADEWANRAAFRARQH